jgi:hypothetical protein
MAIFGEASEFSQQIGFPIPAHLCQEELETALPRLIVHRYTWLYRDASHNPM